MSDDDKVICPNCTHEFVAIPVNAQARIAVRTLVVSGPDLAIDAKEGDLASRQGNGHAAVVKQVGLGGHVDPGAHPRIIPCASGRTPG